MIRLGKPRGEGPIAAVDLGSNSFHMIVARPVDGHLHVMDRLREMVRLAGGLGPDNRLSDEARERALGCLERFGQRLREMPRGSVRAVGTNTLRKARDAQRFLAAAEEALGHPIEIISGVEEARLIYLGVAHGLPETSAPRLVVDIGGGSTELIVGSGFEPKQMESLYIGCVGASARYFPEGRIGRRRFEEAVMAARLELEPVAAAYGAPGWTHAVGASGTVKAIASVVNAQRWCEEGITRKAMKKLRDSLIAAGDSNGLKKLKGLKEERIPVFPGGVAVLYALFQDLNIERMGVSEWALREGLLYDLLGRFRHEDVRERTIAALSARFHVDRAQARRVRETAMAMLEQAGSAWGLQEEEYGNLLSWAAQLHEVGLAIAHAQYHKHGAYMLANADMPGFSSQEQMRLAALVRGHRRKFPHSVFKDLAGDNGGGIQRLCVLLRLAVLLHRSRTDDGMPSLALDPAADGLSMHFGGQWLESHPLTRADLVQEAAFLKSAGFRLDFA